MIVKSPLLKTINAIPLFGLGGLVMAVQEII